MDYFEVYIIQFWEDWVFVFFISKCKEMLFIYLSLRLFKQFDNWNCYFIYNRIRKYNKIIIKIQFGIRLYFFIYLVFVFMKLMVVLGKGDRRDEVICYF